MSIASTESIVADLRDRILAGYPVLALRTWEEDRWEQLLSDLADELDRGLVTWSRTEGWSLELNSPDADGSRTRFLSAIDQFPPDHLIVLKDFQTELADPWTVRALRDLAEKLPARGQAIVMIDPQALLPLELQKEVVVIVPPPPDYRDLRGELDNFLGDAARSELEVTPANEDRLIKSVLGLTIREARRAWQRALLGRTTVDDAAIDLLIQEKRHLASASNFLEFHDLSAGVGDVGGLDELKSWLAQRALAYGPEAREQGIPLPRGVMLLGVQGCGKSLTSRVAARMLSFPLLRLDLSRLLESGQGASEKNLRDVLHLLESIAPVVLWLDELEKGFAGVDGDKFSDATMARILGMFLMWMQEQTHQVFVVATANSIQNLPPELLRRGRFDELFFIDLPNYQERLQILSIHLTRRGWKPERLQVAELARRTDGYSGAELEQLVSTSIIDAFGQGELLSDEILDRTRRNLVPLSKTMEERVFELRQWAQDRCRRATSDNRAAQMLEEETRLTPTEEPVQAAGQPRWQTLAVAGQIKAAVVEYIRHSGEISFHHMMAAFRPHVAVEGDIGLSLQQDPQKVLWVGLSPEFSEILMELVSNRRIYLHPTTPAAYADAPSPKLPILTALTGDKVARPHWLPVLLRNRPSPATQQLSRLRRIQLSRNTKSP